MKAKVITLDSKAAGEVELIDSIYALPVRADILQRTVEWQRAKRQAGTHMTKTVSDVSGTTKKPHRQKGSGAARLGTKRATQCRGGGIVFGPVVRSHAHDLTKKFRALALKTALSAKQAEGKLHIVKDTALASPKTRDVVSFFAKLGWSSVLFVDGNDVDANFRMAIANIPGVDVLPGVGANVYDILRHDNLVLTQAAVEQLEARLA